MTTAKTEALSHLRNLGYTESESRFLYLVATHSGCFVQKQYAEFLGIRANERTTAFIRKAQKKRHIILRTNFQLKGYKLYHIHARRVYQTIGQPDLTFRKLASINQARTRLLVTSFLVANSHQDYLATELEKLDYFHYKKRVFGDSFPWKKFRRRGQKEPTRHAFPDKFPIAVSDRTDPRAVVTFTYMDDGMQKPEAFASYVSAYRVAWQRLGGRYRLVYVAGSDKNFLKSERTYRRILSPDGEKKELVRYFQLRKKHDSFLERNPNSKLSASELAELVRLQSSKAGFPLYEDMYREWNCSGLLNAEWFENAIKTQPFLMGEFCTLLAKL